MKQNSKLIWLVVGGAVIIVVLLYLFFTMPAPVANDNIQTTPAPETLNEEQPLATTTLEGEVVEPTTLVPSPDTETSNTDSPVLPPTKPVVKPPVVIQPAPTEPTTPTTPVEPPPVVVSGISMSVVATHNNANSCWSAIDGSVYDLTSYIPKHPGGKSEILAICGKDGSSLFEGQHGGDSKPARVLSGFYLDVVAE